MTSTTMAISEFLLRRLKEAGIREVSGIPGDFNPAYAADGYARFAYSGHVPVVCVAGSPGRA